MQTLASRNLIGVGRRRDGLYLLEPVAKDRRAFSISVDPEVWHRRLGHASRVKLESICSFDKTMSTVCESCMREKQNITHFPSSSVQSNACFDLIHCDIYGGYKTASFTGARYFLTIVDDYNRGVWIYLMKFKSEACKYLQMFCSMVKT